MRNSFTKSSAQMPAKLIKTAESLQIKEQNLFTDDDGYFTGTRTGSQINEYTVISELGQGSFGRVLLVEDESGKQYAAKISRHQEFFLKCSKKEVEIMESLQQYNITAKIFESFVFEGHFVIIMEVMTQPLTKVLKQRNIGISLQEIKPIARTIAIWLETFKSNKIIHSDIKADNIMYKDNDLKLIDFGSSIRVDNDQMHSYIMSRWFRAPEIVYKVKYSYEIDCWSFGVLLFEMHKLQPLFPSNSTPMLFREMYTLLGMPPDYFIYQNKKIREEVRKFFVPEDYYYYQKHLEELEELNFERQDELYLSEAVLKAGGRPQCELRSFRNEIINPFLNENAEEYDRFYELLSGLICYDPIRRWTPEKVLKCDFLCK